MVYDKIIIGAGIYGMYAAWISAQRGEHVLIIEKEKKAFFRATYANQARVHNGYHYPRSLSTALKTAAYFERFNENYGFCIYSCFKQIYAISREYSWTNGTQFSEFCHRSGIPCEEVSVSGYFKKNVCDAAFLTTENTYDAGILRDYFLNEIEKSRNIDFCCNTRIESVECENDRYTLITEQGDRYTTGYVLNATYASTNQIIRQFGFEPFSIKYELCEIILGNVSEKLKDVGITVMDGPFFSVMPFGKTGYHSLTSVMTTPHETSYQEQPVFDCQKNSDRKCTEKNLANCMDCACRPETVFPYMYSLMRKYLRDEFDFYYEKSLFSVKPILKSSELDDSRPTLIRKYSDNPTFVSVLSGKINTIFDLDEYL